MLASEAGDLGENPVELFRALADRYATGSSDFELGTIALSRMLLVDSLIALKHVTRYIESGLMRTNWTGARNVATS